MKLLRDMLPLLPLALVAQALASDADTARSAPPDSLAPSYAMQEVVVTATRWESVSSRTPSGATVISREAITSMPGSLLSSPLSWTPGLSLRAYGGGASVETISLRGMSPEHTLVLIDGERYNSFQNGLADFGLLFSSNVERVEVVRGGSSALYGADAVGGVINVITRAPEEGLHGSASVMLGSHHTGASEIRLGGGWDDFGVRGSIRREEGRGDYTFRFQDGNAETTLTRTGEDYAVLAGDLRADWKASPGVRGSASYAYTGADRGSPGVVTDPSSAGSARLRDHLHALRTTADWDALQGITLRLSGSGRYGLETYDDPGQLLGGSTVRSAYTTHDYILTPQALFSISPGVSGMAGVEYSSASLRSSETLDANRSARSVFLSTEHDIPLPWEGPWEIIFYPSLRYDDFSDVRGDVSPRLGVNIGLLKDPLLRLRGSYGKSFRAPVLNDLYWIAGGNPSLRPERALSFDAGLRSEFRFLGSWRIDLSYFSIRSRDRIVWVPSSGTFWSPKNISSVTSRGVESELLWSGLEGLLRLSLNATWTDVTKRSADFPGDPTEGKRLIYEPPQTFNAVAEIAAGPAHILLRHSWVSYRYTTEINDRFLPSYSLESAAVRFVFPVGPLHAALKAEVNNLLNTSYQVVALYPMPLREFRVTMEAAL